MTTLTIRIESLRDAAEAIRRSLRQEEPERDAGLSFVDYETMHRVLTPKRLDLVRCLAGQGVLSFREVSRRAERDFKAVHADLTALIEAGVIDRTPEGVVFRHDGLRFAIDIRADAA
jgi:predicted transcriptional regulator